MRVSGRPDLSATRWRASSYSNADGGNCVEVADGFSGLVPVRDSKCPEGVALVFGAAAWGAFLAEVRAGR